MKKLLLFAAILFGLSAQAQLTNVVFKVGSAGVVNIDNQDYERGYITYRWYLSGTDTLVELAREYNTSQPFRSGRVISKYKDGDNASAAFASFAAWRTWWRANGEPKPDTIVSGGSSYPQIVADYYRIGINDTFTAINYTPTTDSGTFMVLIDGYTTAGRVNSVFLTYTPPYGSAITEQIYMYTNNNATAINATYGSAGVKFDPINPHMFRATSAAPIKVYVSSVSGGGSTLNTALNVTLMRLK